MTNKRILYLDVQTSTADPQQGVILSIAAVLDKKTKKNPIVSAHVLVAPTPMQWMWAEPAMLDQSNLTWELLQEEGRPWQEVRDEFSQWLAGNGVAGGKAIVLAYDVPRVLGFLERYLGSELELAHFPFDNVFDIRDYYSILTNRRVMPLLPDRSLRAISYELKVDADSELFMTPVVRVNMIMQCYEKMLELGVRE